MSLLFGLPKNSAIIVYQGGLGNQLFQYLLGRELQKVFKKNVIYYDIRKYYKKNHKSDIQNLFQLKLRKYNIDKSNFLVKFILLSPLFLRFNKFVFQKLKIKIFSNYFFDNNNKPIILENFKNNDNLLIFFGTWHNLINQYIYSKNIKNLKFKNINLPKNYNFQKKFISLHVRRGDYCDPKTSNFHGNLNLNYYLSAIEFLRNKFGNIPVLLFSDDTEWISKNLSYLIKNSIVISSLKSSPEIDFYIMSKANYFILSNSTFAWLSAFLSEKKDKFVVLPKYWFKNEKINSYHIYKDWKYEVI
nr:alpha-1,2-fucosyltransferase [Prochlorococcus marinus]